MTVAEAIAGCGLEPLEARMLLSHATGLSRVSLISHPEAVLDLLADKAFAELASRRRDGVPVAYLMGEREFYGLPLLVSPAVLIPRPETELLVEFALEHLPRNGTLLDLGTGSGAIALAVKHERPDAQVSAVDTSVDALEVARANAARHALQIEFMQGNWLEPMAERKFDLIVSNPPYVADDDAHLGQGDLRFEPRGALAAGPDGLRDIRVIVNRARGYLRRGGWLAIEHGAGQDREVRGLLHGIGLEEVVSRPDLAGIARISVGKYNPD